MTSCNSAAETPAPVGKVTDARPDKSALLDEVKKSLGPTAANRTIVADEPFRVWPRALAGDRPFGWGARAEDLQMIDSPVEGGLAQRIEMRTGGNFTIRMQPPPDKYLFFRCSVEPSNLTSSPSTPGLVRWETQFGGGTQASGDFVRDPVSNYWTFATTGVTTGNRGHVRITSPMGPEPIWAIGFCDVLTFELPPP